jgi:hypothetical protein
VNGVGRAVVVLLLVLGLAGCHGEERVPTAPPATAAADPFADVEAGVDAIARDLESDADAGR